MTQITIAYAPDNNRVTLTLTAMASVLKNAKKTDEIEFVILYSAQHLDEKYLPTFDNLQVIKPYKLNMIKVDENINMKNYIKNPADLLEYYGILRYTTFGNVKAMTIKTVDVKSNKDKV